MDKDKDQTNIAETIFREARKPGLLELGGNDTHLAVPDGFKLEDIEKFMPVPRRKRGKVSMNDADSFIAYAKRHGSLTASTIWCDANYQTGKIKLTAILNDHGEAQEETAWRDHIATFAPAFSEEWNRWYQKHAQPFDQAAFAAFLEENSKDIASAEGSPTGVQMLEMALGFEANQDLRFKSAMRLQNGAVQISYVENDDDQTLKKMQMFDKFSIGIPVFWEGEAYRIDARLRYRARDGKVNFWFELIRPDKVLEDATKGLVEKVKTETGRPFFNGNPFA